MYGAYVHHYGPDNVYIGTIEGVFIRLGDGTGGFGAATGFDLDYGVDFMATGDFNKDGALDLVLASQQDSVGILPGHGKGNFGALTNYSACEEVWNVAVGDFNGDGITDLATVE